MISSSTYSRCHIVCGYLHYSFILMIGQNFSRGTTRTRDRLHTRQRYMGSKWMQSMILGLHIFIFFQPTPTKKYTNLGLSLLHAQVFALLDTLCSNFYQCHFDNFYMSAKFAYKSFIKNFKILKCEGQGVTKQVIQHNMLDKKSDLVSYVLCVCMYVAGQQFVRCVQITRWLCSNLGQ